MFNAFSITNNDMSKMIAMSNTNYDILVEIVNEVIGNGGPSGVFDTLQELNDRYPKGAKGVYLVTVNGKWYYWNGSEWVAGGVYQATQLADGSVTDVKLDIDLQHKINSIEGIGQEAEKANVDLASHKSSSQAHNAAAITYSGQVQASDVKEAIDKTNARISNIVAQSGNDNTEIRDARGGFNVLGDRLNSTDEQLAEEVIQRRRDIAANKYPLSKFSQVEGREMIAFCNATVKSTTRLNVNSSTLNEVVLEKTDAANPAVIEWNPTYEKNPFNAKTFDFIITSPDISQISEIELRIYPGDGGYYNKLLGPQLPKTPYYSKPLLLRTPIISFTNNGATAPFKLLSTGYIQLRITGTLGAKLTIHKGFFGGYPKSPVMIQFDDGNLSVYEKAFPLMKERGIVGTFNIITNRVGTPGSVTWDHLHEMQDAGWSIGNHTHTHIDLMTGGTVQQVLADAELAQRILANRGFTGSKILAPPFNSLDSTRVDYFRHIMLARKTGATYGGPVVNSLNYVTMQGRSVPYNATVAGLLSDYQSMVDVGNYFSPTFHIITEGTPNPALYEFNVNDFEAFLDGLLAQNAYFTNVEQFVETYVITSGDIG